uniref:Nucleoprotein n=2 Tax=Rhabdoviridae TaxID=11270 RepID=A0A2I5YP52_9RHAB|nr:nucleoprotein [Perhabdovirus perca]QIQ19265.1 nucleoprotein [Perhabdovirus perca]UVT38876.1 nucleoprotein [Perhabdovirus perca]
METGAIVVRSTQASFVPLQPQLEDEINYPADFFVDQKIPTFVHYYENAKPEDLLGMIFGELSESRLPSELVTSYIYSVMSKWTETLDAPWESFGIEFGDVNDILTPFSLLKCIDSDQALADYKTVAVPGDIDPIAMMIFLLAPYRIVGIQNEEYQARVIQTIQNQLDSLGAKRLNVRSLKNVTTLTRSPNYLKLVAAIDMFYFHFKNSQERAVVRVATLGSRHKDCAALSTLNHIVQFTGKPLIDVLDWVFTDQVAQEVSRMMRPGQEIDKADSYMPYLKDLGLCRKSPYSSSANPGVHCWAQMTCALLGSKRSQNAIASTEENLVNLTRNAEIMAYVLGTGAVLVKALEIGGIKGTDPDAIIVDVDGDGEPTTLEALDWLDFVQTNGCQLTPKMEAKIRVMSLRIQNARKDTIGAYLKGRAVQNE